MRRKAGNRLEDIAEAAVACFTDMGIKRTQMADVARTAGVSAGTLYLYVASKEALFHLAILRVCDRPLDKLALPLTDPGIEETVAVYAARVAEVAEWPALRAARAPGARPGHETLVAIGGELYDMLHEARRAIWLLDHCAREIPAFDSLLSTDMRGHYRDDIAAVALKAAGRTGTPNAAIRLAARLAIEIIAWAAMHRMKETPANLIDGLDEAGARKTATESFAAVVLAAAGGN
ncbi:MAG: helix-turn-helix domain-containing protein [Parvibaculum sp.]|uniref:TetR/AcrR family transcriptional regulator n=1 Tax=Parvibaculum sp. TaxID=2024848 RepID=UPI0027247424|nr:TetR/AcrR family transcriptional regulator [Parvibaculum sp.]MDO8839687.1 helix-turn-helix domain-containing protein [Parvibaculum sp.]